MKKKKSSNGHHNHRHKNDENVLLENNSLRLRSSKSKSPYSERLHKSNADLREQYLKDETRGGLAAAYKNRQQQKNQQQQNRHRTLSLNRMNAITTTNTNDDDDDGQQNSQYPTTIKPHRHLSQSQLSSRYSDIGVENNQQPPPPPRSLSSSSRARSIQHERDPIVMYIPPVNNESPKLTSILRNNSTKSNITVQSKGKKSKQQQPQLKSQSKINLKDAVVVDPNGRKKSNDGKRTDLNRRYSMPKDTKFNWLNKFKLKK
ncbi:hypothetical protein BLA29_009742 [Euroglyphus maynei]|uniref:Uncharacterized protein n=1 Tax=Euroglyphus maynei TaxID=6958 RepID=A0A1Y3B4A3_EURMA|nr:hypothetical protein BLA29_009742 [Euroglyphus maynei]